MVDESLVVFTPDRAAQISGLSRRQVDYWRSTTLVQPSTNTRLTPAQPVRLYSFVDMMSLMVVAELLKRGVSLPRVRALVAQLRERGYSDPLTQVVFGTIPRRSRKGKAGRPSVAVAIQHSDGSWEGEADPGQLIIRESLDMAEIRARIAARASRPDDAAGHIESRPRTLGRKPVLAGTRIPVATVREYVEQGVPDAEILEAFPALTLRDVEAVRDLAAS